jgi:protein-S-isoprenylcysteine O-methyltransferase Ste14
MSLKSKWIDFLYKSATATKKTRTLLTPVGALIFGFFLFIFVYAAIQFDNFLKLPGMFTISGLSIVYFLKVKGTPVPVNPPPKLVNTGPYRYIRNPMLSGIFFLMFGIGFLIDNFSLIFIFTPLFMLINAWELKMIEEPELSRRLGKKYDDYKNITPMFIPGTKFFLKK